MTLHFDLLPRPGDRVFWRVGLDERPAVTQARVLRRSHCSWFARWAWDRVDTHPLRVGWIRDPVDAYYMHRWLFVLWQLLAWGIYLAVVDRWCRWLAAARG